MSSYKGHTLFALILSLLFFHNPLIVALTVIGANIPDFDHKFKRDTVYKIIILGLVLFIVLYILKLPYLLGLIVLFLGLTFYFSQHRSFTHSIFGLFVLTATVSLILIFAAELIPFSNAYILMFILIILIGFLFLNTQLLAIFIACFVLSILFFGPISINYIEVAFGLFLGILSHIVLDSFSPAGIKLFAPISSKKVYKKFGMVIIAILAILAIVYYFYYGNFFIDLILGFLRPMI